MTDNTARMRVSLILTKAYVEALNYLVEEGLYMEIQTAIRAALRLLFHFHGIEPFRSELIAELLNVQE